VTVTLRIDQLNAAIANLEALARLVDIVPVGLSEESKTKLEHLRLTGRDFFEVTPALQQSALRFGRAAVEQMIMSGQRYTVEQLYQPLADGAGKAILLRFSGGGNDASFTPLKASTIKSKSKRGHPSDIGVDSGDLKKNMFAVTWKAKPK
jgi:hypothetical protein